MVDNPAAGGRGFRCDNDCRELLRLESVAPRLGEVKRGVAQKTCNYPHAIHIRS